MPKGEIVGNNLLLPLVTTLSMVNTFTELFTMFSSHHVASASTEWVKAYVDLQCLPSRTVLTGHLVFTESSALTVWSSQ